MTVGHEGGYSCLVGGVTREVIGQGRRGGETLLKHILFEDAIIASNIYNFKIKSISFKVKLVSV